jgi:hypothetical protein
MMCWDTWLTSGTSDCNRLAITESMPRMSSAIKVRAAAVLDELADKEENPDGVDA